MSRREGATTLLRALICLVIGAMTLIPAADADEGTLTWNKPEHDFGVVGQNQDLEASFTFTNSGEATVSDITAQPDCGCYGLELSDTVLGPGESGTLRIRFRTLSFIGTVAKSARIQYTDTKRRSTRLPLKLRVEAGVLLSQGTVYFGEVIEGRRPQTDIQVVRRVPPEQKVKMPDGTVVTKKPPKLFKVTRVDLPPGEFASITPAPYVDIPKKPVFEGWTLTFRFTKPPPKGVYSKQAVIHTDHPDYPQLRISLTANIVGKVWVQTSRLYAGLVPAGQTRELRALVRPAHGAGVKLGKVSARARKGLVEARLDPVPGRPDHYTLVVTVPITAKPGRIDDIVEIHTQVQGEKVTTVQVKGRVFKKIG